MVKGSKNNEGMYALNTKVEIITMEEAHHRLGHMPTDDISTMEVKGELDFKLSTRTMKTCQVCATARITRSNIPKARSTERKTTPGERLHMDIWGPAQLTSFDKKRFIGVIIDEATNFIVTRNLHSKGEMTRFVMDTITQMKTQENIVVKSIRSDNGKEFQSNELKAYCNKYGILMEYTVAYTSFQNGMAERAIRTITERVLCLKEQSGLHIKYWTLMVTHATLILNYTRRNNQIPAERFKNVNYSPLDMTRMIEFGKDVVVWIPKQKRQKLDSRGQIVKYVGYDKQRKGIIVLSKDGKVGFSRDFRHIQAQQVKQDQNEVQQQEVEFIPVLNQLPEISTTIQRHVESKDHIPIELPNEAVIESSPPTVYHDARMEPETPVSPLQRKSTITLDGEILRATDKVGIYKDRYGNRVEIVSDRFVPPNDITGPPKNPVRRMANVVQAVHSEKPQSVQEARAKEMESIMENQTYILVPRSSVPKGKTIMPCRFVDNTKLDEDGSEFYKSRIVAGGHRQKAGLDFDEIFAHTINRKTIRFLIALATIRKWTIRIVDFVTAYLNADMDQDLYMEQPPGFEQGNDMICLLKKGLYGSKQGARLWQFKAIDIFERFGFQRLNSDASLFVNFDYDGHLIIIGLYVDDCLIIGTDEDAVKKFELELSKIYKVKILGEVKRILKMNIVRTKDYTYIHQMDYIENMLNRFEMTNCIPIGTPAVKDLLEDSELLPNNQRYMEAVGSLIYLATNTRPDISYAVSKVAEKMANPTKSDWNNVKRIFRYLKGTKEYGLYYDANDELTLNMYADADYANDISRKSRSGIMLYN